MLCFAVLALVADFGVRVFNASDPMFARPFVLFPYFDAESDGLRVFEEATREEEDVVVAALDCVAEVTACSRMGVRPGGVYVSFPPHRRVLRSQREFSVAGLRALVRDVRDGNVRFDIDSVEKVREVAGEAPLFALVARSNAGDLEGKRPAFEEVAKESVNSRMTFAVLSESALYEMFGVYPLSSFVFIPPTLKHVTFSGEFEVGRLEAFVAEHGHRAYSSDWPKEGVAVVIASENWAKDVSDGLLGLVNVVVTNGSLIFCKEKGCVPLVDFTNSRVVRLGGYDRKTVEKALSEFDSLWNAVPIPEKVMTWLRIKWIKDGDVVAATAFCAFTGLVLVVIYVFQLVTVK